MNTVAEYRRLLAEYAPQPIHSRKAYERAMKQLEAIMVPRPDAARSLLIEMLATLIEKYESREFPTPTSTPAELLAKLLRANRLKPADLARETGIPAATISNVLADRRGISTANAFKLGEYFGLSPLVFLGGKRQNQGAAR